MGDNCGLWVEYMGVVSRRWVELVGGIYGCGYNLSVWLVDVVVRRYIDFLIILLILTPLVSALFCSSIPTSLFILKCFLNVSSPFCVFFQNIFVFKTLSMFSVFSVSHLPSILLYPPLSLPGFSSFSLVPLGHPPILGAVSPRW